jgi:predicted ATP-grasp superfamily ATP-dependent carboligase
MNDQPRVLITNAEERSMLAVCRSLHQAGYDVAAASFNVPATTHWSRACRWRPRLPDPRNDSDGFLEQLRHELTRRSYAALIPGSDGSLLAISRGRERLAGLTETGLPPAAIVERACSRQSLADTAAGVGLTPAVSIPCTGFDQASVAAQELGFPVVLKSAHIAGADAQGISGAPKGQIVSTAADLAQALRAFDGEDLLVQRCVRGDLISFGGVAAGGELLGVAVSRYLRMWPPDSGSVAFGETIPVPPHLEESVRGLLAAIGWEGIFELELIRSGAEDFVPIDLNPRPYGSIALAAAAGAPLAAIWCDWLRGHRRSAQPLHARPGCRYRWEDGDLRHLGWQLQHRNYRAALAPLRPHRGVTHAHFQIADPLPLFALGLYLGRKSLARRAAARF